ncbi:ABC transporter permease [Kribbella albertanoniae]|uniref:FtsX-like permease family protein n=1 Tax=Kribbella albertanoniae TaxID=1266829 RepID=A0A4R4PRY9_9ACTN|nr:ABC transporter permease [Kribbella albertanoniae]TDC25056.1 FtsX-like permease family protein [Kribbella albertanoniae]
MTGIALRLLRHRPGSVLATLIALIAGVTILTSMGALVESGLRPLPEPQQYANAEIVVAKRDLTITGKQLGDPYTATVQLPERGSLPAGLADELRKVPGVENVAGNADALTLQASDRVAVEKVAASAGAQVYTGNDRVLVERPDIAEARGLLIEVGGAFGGYVVMLVMFVVAGTIGLSIRSRRRDLALLRATAATPGQVRRMLMAEAAILAVAGSVVGVPAGLLASRWLGEQLVARGFVPADYGLSRGLLAAPAAVLLIVLVALGSALLASRKLSGIRPAEALSQIAVEPARLSKVRLGFGLVALTGAVSSSAVSVGAGGQAALAGAVSMLYLFVLAVALLAPWINGITARYLAPVLRAGWGNSGYLAAKNLAANARGGATVLTALVLSIGFGGSVWFLQDNVERQTVQQLKSGTLAQYTVLTPGEVSVEKLGRIPGVEAVTPMRQTAVIVKVLDTLEVVPAQAIDPAQAKATLDLKVRKGELAAVGPDSIAVSATQAASRGWKVGDEASLWLGDGTPKRLRVAAIYERGLGFGDVVLSTATFGQPPTKLLIRATPDAVPALKAAIGQSATLIPSEQATAGVSKDLAISAWLNKLLITVMIGYAGLAAANTMTVAALARRRELAVLQLAGVTTRQLKRMVHAEQAGLLGVSVLIGGVIAAVTLTAVVYALTGGAVPYVPLAGVLAILGGATLIAMGTTIVPIARLLRQSSLAAAGTRE